MKKHPNNRLSSLLSKFKNSIKMRVSTLIQKLNKKTDLELKPIQALPPHNNKHIQMGIQIDTIELIEDEQGEGDIVIIKISSSPEIILESKNDFNIDSLETQPNNILIPFPSSTRIH